MKGGINEESVLRALRSVLPASSAPFALHEPLFNGHERAYLMECIDTGWVSSAGAFVARFEAMLEDYIGVKRAVAVVNGTSALHIGLKLAGVNAGDEVIAPTLTFVAPANAVSYGGAVPHFADISPKTLGIDPAKLNDHLRDIAVKGQGHAINRLTGRPLKAVIAMHAFGHPVDIDPLLDVCDRFRIPLMEDAAQSLGSF
ncbi:MAG: aminotransferase class I/II-fold pyridoxal phosphate-dependent enzyme, partial [Deltaproteobacteria bacterium]